jgi:hypothetical protein
LLQLIEELLHLIEELLQLVEELPQLVEELLLPRDEFFPPITRKAPRGGGGRVRYGRFLPAQGARASRPAQLHAHSGIRGDWLMQSRRGFSDALGRLDFVLAPITRVDQPIQKVA